MAGASVEFSESLRLQASITTSGNLPYQQPPDAFIRQRGEGKVKTDDHLLQMNERIECQERKGKKPTKESIKHIITEWPHTRNTHDLKDQIKKKKKKKKKRKKKKDYFTQILTIDLFIIENNHILRTGLIIDQPSIFWLMPDRPLPERSLVDGGESLEAEPIQPEGLEVHLRGVLGILALQVHQSVHEGRGQQTLLLGANLDLLQDKYTINFCFLCGLFVKQAIYLLSLVLAKERCFFKNNLNYFIITIIIFFFFSKECF